MQLRDLSYFVQAAAFGHIGRAANALGLTQPALTKSVARLESELNARLFERTPKGVKLTPFGQHLLRHATRLQATVVDIKRELADFSAGATGHLRIGSGLTMAEHLLPVACAQLLTKFPHVTFNITAGTGDSLMPALRDGHLDLVLSGIAAEAAPDLHQDMIMQDEVVVVARSTHPLHRRRKVTLEELKRERWVLSKSGSLLTNWLTQRYRDIGMAAPTPAVETDSLSTQLSIVSNSDLLTFQSWLTIRRSPMHATLRPLTVSKLVWRRRVGATYRNHGYIPPAAKKLIEILKAISADETSVPSAV